MKIQVYSNKGESVGKVDFPRLEIPERRDLIQKLYRSVTLSGRQPYGTKVGAGMRSVGHNSGPNHGTARIPRSNGGRRGVILANMVGGKSAHAPVIDKRLHVGINKKEGALARKSAIAMTFNVADVIGRGHTITEDIKLPLVVKDDIQDLSRSSEARELLVKLGLEGDLDRAKNGKKVRAGRGKMRGRRYKRKKSVLIVGTDSRKLAPFKSLPGVETATIDTLGIRKLAPGGKPGRLTVYTETALNQVLEVLK